MPRLPTLIVSCMLLCLSGVSHAHELDFRISAWDYHTFAPFHLDHTVHKDAGLSHDFIRMLIKHGEHYEYDVASTSRARINRSVATGSKGMLLWVNPLWFKQQKGASNLQWSIPVISDSNELLSRKDDPFDYEGPQSLYGRTLGVVRFWRIAPLEKDLESGKIKRNDADELRHNLSRLLSGKVDVALIPGSAARFMIRDWDVEDDLHLSHTPLQTFDRHIALINFKDDPVMLAELNATILKIQADPEWQQILESYGFKP